MAGKRIHLHCPTLKQTISNYTIVPSATYAQNLQHLRAAFGTLKTAWPWDTHGHSITDFKSLLDGQRILVAGDYFEPVQAETTLEILNYSRDDAWEVSQIPVTLLYYDSITPRSPTELNSETQRMSRTKKLSHISILRKSDRKGHKSMLRLTLPHSTIKPQLDVISAGTSSVFERLSAASCHAELLENWQMKFDAMWAVPGEVVKPRMEEERWDPKLLPTLAILSQMTLGQALIVRHVIVRAVKARGVQEMGVEDVVGVIDWLYECAG
jgi:hypothetical protein